MHHLFKSISFVVSFLLFLTLSPYAHALAHALAHAPAPTPNLPPNTETSPSTTLNPRHLTFSTPPIKCYGNSHTRCVHGDFKTLYRNAADCRPQCHVPPGKPLICEDNNICIFNDNTDQYLTCEIAKAMLAKLKEHGCESCGRVRMEDQPRNADGSYGVLKVDYYEGTVCNGFCEAESNPECFNYYV